MLHRRTIRLCVIAQLLETNLGFLGGRYVTLLGDICSPHETPVGKAFTASSIRPFDSRVSCGLIFFFFCIKGFKSIILEQPYMGDEESQLYFAGSRVHVRTCSHRFHWPS